MLGLEPSDIIPTLRRLAVWWGVCVCTHMYMCTHEYHTRVQLSGRPWVLALHSNMALARQPHTQPHPQKTPSRPSARDYRLHSSSISRTGSDGALQGPRSSRAPSLLQTETSVI